jgi:uncharacterized membrane protein
MKRFFFFFVLFLFFPHPIYAQVHDGWVIDDFKSDVIIQKDGKVAVHEIITTDFSDSKHGIYRDIPYVYTDGSKKTYTDITLGEVYQDDRKATVDLSEINGYKRIRIGDSSRTLTGKHTYDITYVVTGVLRSFTDHDELYWNVTGNNWDTQISHASVTVTLPKEGITRIACYEGIMSSTFPCIKESQTLTQAVFSNQNPIFPSYGMTVAVGYTKGMVPILIVTPPKSLEDTLFTPASFGTFALSFATGLVLLVVLWTRKGRDLWYRTRSMFDPHAKAASKPLFMRQIVSVEFEPPNHLRPAEIGVLMDEKADTLDVSATIIDLATRGYLSIKEIPKTWLLGTIDYELKKEKNADDILLPYERTLLTKLFSSKDAVLLSSLKKKFYTSLKTIKSQLYTQVMTRKLFVTNPESTRTLYQTLGIGITVLGAFCIFMGIKLIIGPLVTFGAGIVLTGLILIPFSRSMPRRTALGQELYERVKGYKLFIGGAEQYRQQFYEKKNMFNEVLPYAIVLGLTGKFAKAMQDMGIQPENPSWYTGTHAFSPVYFASNINSFSDSISAVMASTPSTSGGFSGGGSGGGFGGGGGGSW